MKKTSAVKKPSVTNLRREIQLDESQFAIYNTGKLDILNPDGEPIDVIGTITKRLNETEERERVANNLRLLEELFLGNVAGANLSEHAIAGLSHALSEAQEIIGR